MKNWLTEYKLVGSVTHSKMFIAIFKFLANAKANV